MESLVYNPESNYISTDFEWLNDEKIGEDISDVTHSEPISLDEDTSTNPDYIVPWQLTD